MPKYKLIADKRGEKKLCIYKTTNKQTKFATFSMDNIAQRDTNPFAYYYASNETRQSEDSFPSQKNKRATLKIDALNKNNRKIVLENH